MGDEVRWRLQFYNERRGILARYDVEARLPAEAVLLGQKALRAEHPPERARRRPSLIARAERLAGYDGSGWILYRIGRDGAVVDRT